MVPPLNFVTRITKGCQLNTTKVPWLHYVGSCIGQAYFPFNFGASRLWGALKLCVLWSFQHAERIQRFFKIIAFFILFSFWKDIIV